jgi:hypothetical protein
MSARILCQRVIFYNASSFTARHLLQRELLLPPILYTCQFLFAVVCVMNVHGPASDPIAHQTSRIAEFPVESDVSSDACSCRIGFADDLISAGRGPACALDWVYDRS